MYQIKKYFSRIIIIQMEVLIKKMIIKMNIVQIEVLIKKKKKKSHHQYINVDIEHMITLNHHIKVLNWKIQIVFIQVFLPKYFTMIII